MEGRRKQRFRWLGTCVALVVALAALTVSACGSDEGDGGDAGGGSPDNGAAVDSGEQVRLGYFGIGLANDFVQAELKGVRQGAAANDAEVTVFDGKFDSTVQVGQVQDAVAGDRIDAMVIFPVDGTAVVPAIEQAIDAGISVVTVNSPIGKDLNTLEPQVDGITSTVNSESLKQGEGLGELTVGACEQKNADPCNVIYMPGTFAQAFEATRLNGYKSVIARHPQIKVSYADEGLYTRDGGFKSAQDALQANSDVDVFVTSGDQMTTGAEQALADAGIDGVPLIGLGATETAVEGIEAGTWFGTWAYVPVTQGELAAELAIDAARGEDVPPFVDTTTLTGIGGVLTKDNLAEFKGPEWDG